MERAKRGREREKKRLKGACQCESHITNNRVSYGLVGERGAPNGLPSTGMASDTWGSVSVTRLWKTVRERRMVTPARDKDGKGISEAQ